MALDPALIQQLLSQRQAGPQPSQIGSPDQAILGGIQPAPGQVNFANVLGGMPQEDAFGYPGMAGAPTPPTFGVMPQLQMQQPAASPQQQPTPFDPATLLGDLFTRANNNSGPATPYQEKQFVARKNAFPVKNQAGVLSGAPMGIQGLT